MLILPIAWGEAAQPTLYDSGRVFSTIAGRRQFIGTFRGESVTQVIMQAYHAVMVAKLAAKMAVNAGV